MNKDNLNNVIKFQIEDEFLDLEKELAERDFSKESNKQAVFLKTLKNMNESEGVKNMKIMDGVKKVGVMAASVVLVATIGMQTTFGQDLVEKIIAKISLTHFTAVQYEDKKAKEITVPISLKGKIFDKEGKPIEVITDEVQEIYTASGEKIEEANPVSGKITTEKEQEKLRENTILTVRDAKKLNDYTCFKVILPTYLPEGYAFEKAEFYKDEQGRVKNSKYIELYFLNQKTGHTIDMQQRFADEETACELGTDGKVEKIKINGADAILEDNRGIDWEANGNIYFLNAGKKAGVVSKEELIKIAESVK